MREYGPRDAASVLMGRGHRVALRYRSLEGHTQWAVYLDGQPVTLRELEDQAEKHEKLKNRITERAPRSRPAAPLRSASVVTDLHR